MTKSIFEHLNSFNIRGCSCYFQNHVGYWLRIKTDPQCKYHGSVRTTMIEKKTADYPGPNDDVVNALAELESELGRLRVQMLITNRLLSGLVKSAKEVVEKAKKEEDSSNVNSSEDDTQGSIS